MFKQNDSSVYQEHGTIDASYVYVFYSMFYNLEESVFCASFLVILVWISVEDPGPCCNIGFYEITAFQ